MLTNGVLGAKEKSLINVLKRLIESLRLEGAPETRDEALSSSRITSHQEVVNNRGAFRQLSMDLHQEISSVINSLATKPKSKNILEIGSGVIPLSSVNPNAISSDIIFTDRINCQLNAESIPLVSDSLRAIVAQNVFHHIDRIFAAISEMERVTARGGVIVIIEPNHNWFSRLIYPKLFSFEGYDCGVSLEQQLLNAAGEKIPNQAMSYILFVREVESFKQRFPHLEVVKTQPLTSGLRYLGTGGLNFKQLMPSWLLRQLRRAENRSKLSRLLSFYSLHWMVVLQVKSSKPDSTQFQM